MAHDVWQQIVVDRGDSLPPYQQICNALRHKIATNQLSAGMQLPSIRFLAQNAGVTPGTVARAYRSLQEEGLVEAKAGVGTIVADVGSSPRLDLSRQELDEAINTLIRSLARRGYTPLEVQEAVTRRLEQFPRPKRIGFIAQAPSVVRKYTHLLEAELRDLSITVIPLGLPDLEAASHDTQQLLSTLDHVVTLLSFLRNVQDALGTLDLPVSVLLTELSLNTNQQLRNIPSDANVALVAESHYRTTGLGMLQPYCRPDSITVVRDLSIDALRHTLTSSDHIVHTLGTSDLVKEVITPGQQAIELEFQPRNDSLRTIKETLASLDR